MPETGKEKTPEQQLYELKKVQISQYLLSLNTQIQALQNQLKQAEIDRERAVGGMLMLDELMKTAEKTEKTEAPE